MRIKITKSGIYGAKGGIPVGTELTVKEEPKGWDGRYEVISGGEDGKTAVTNPAGSDQKAATYEAKHRGGGSYSIVDGDGKEVAEKLTKADADSFNAMSDAEKAEYVKASA